MIRITAVDNLQLIVIAVVQGVTEFLPISSSGHLILIPALTGWPDQGLPMDVAVHLGTLAAVVLYFWRDLVSLASTLRRPWGRLNATSREGFDRHRFRSIAIATIPIVFVGAAYTIFDVEPALRSVYIIAVNSIFWGILLYVADRYGQGDREMKDMTLRQAFIVGLMQCLALVPGTSRSGVTMTGARFLGLKRTDAASFSFLISVPAVAAAGFLGVRDLIKIGNLQLIHDAIFSGTMAFLAGLAAIAYLINRLKKHGMLPFVVYRILLGVGLLVWAAYQ